MRKVERPCTCGDVKNCRYCYFYENDPYIRTLWGEEGKGVGNSVGNGNGNGSEPPTAPRHMVQTVVRRPDSEANMGRRVIHPGSSPTPNLREIPPPTLSPNLRYEGGTWSKPVQPQNPNEVVWACGITTVVSRIHDLLPRTIKQVEKAGFVVEDVYCDRLSPTGALSLEHSLRKRVHARRQYGSPRDAEGSGKGNAWANYMLALWDLSIRYRTATRFLLFQDDVTCCKNVKDYLSRMKLEDKTYWNLYTAFINEDRLVKGGHKGKNGWHFSDQRGRGALALVLSREAVEALLSSTVTGTRPRSAKRSWSQNIDGWIQAVLIDVNNYREYCHNPSLVQHAGADSILGNPAYAPSGVFAGEDFDCLSLLGK